MSGYQDVYGDGGGMRDETPLDFDVVGAVKDFVFDMHDSMRRSQILTELDVLYSQTFPKLSEEYYKSEPWPTAEVIGSQCGRDELFLCFYKEMRLRHINVYLNASIHDRFEAWGNYCKLFDALLDCADTDLVITPSWAFDIMNEFVYQFQSFCQFRTSLDTRSSEEVSMLAENQDVWAVQNVMSYLHGLIRVSNITGILAAKKAPHDRNGRLQHSAPKSPSQLHETIGYFAIITMSRLQCLLADYSQCLQVLEPIDVTDHRGELFGASLAAYTSLFMHMSLSFIMLRRYHDAARSLTEILLHISRAIKSGQAIPDLVPKQFDKMLALLAIVTVLAPGAPGTDEQIAQIVNDKYKGKLLVMTQGDVDAFRDLFQWACPKFIVASVPDFASGGSTSSGALLQQQVRLFVDDVKQQMMFPAMRSYLRLYTSISVEKMARFNGMKREDFIAALVSMKHKVTQKSASWGMGGDMHPLEGKPSLALDFNFFVQGETVVIDEQAHEQRFEGYFLAEIAKCETIVQQAESIVA
jgi:translation initiation factor 3 subunit L